MNVILIDDVKKLGEFGDVVRVAPGYARNYLLPQKMAVIDSPAAQRIVEIKRRHMKKGEEQALDRAKELAQKISAISITIVRKVGEKEKLFGSVTAIDIMKALKEEGITIDKKQIHLDEPLKALGIYTVAVKLHPEITENLKLWVVKP